jgi:5'-nucleotidase
MTRHRQLFFFCLILTCLAWISFGNPAFAQRPYRILISNDDGIQAPGIKALCRALKTLGEVTVAAPAANQSLVGHSLTFSIPIAVEEWESEGAKWFSIAATPATCVRLALTSLLRQMPDIVISGINKGENTGVVTFSSATVACAREAAFRGIAALSVSLQNGPDMDYGAAADFIASLVLDVRKRGLTPGTYLNINYPALPKERIKGVLVAVQDRRPPDEHYEKRGSPEGKKEFFSIYKPLQGGMGNCDTWALTHGYISVTPLTIDQTRYPQIDNLQSWDTLNPKK